MIGRLLCLCGWHTWVRGRGRRALFCARCEEVRLWPSYDKSGLYWTYPEHKP